MAGSAGLGRGRASRTVRYEAEPRNEPDKSTNRENRFRGRQHETNRSWHIDCDRVPGVADNVVCCGAGRLDIVTKPYTWDTPRVDPWLNQAVTKP